MLRTWKIVYKKVGLTTKNVMTVHADTLDKAEEVALLYVNINEIIGIIEDNNPKISEKMLLNEGD